MKNANLESLTANNFKVVKKCNNEYETKIQEALFIKKTESQLKLSVICQWVFVAVKCVLMLVLLVFTFFDMYVVVVVGINAVYS